MPSPALASANDALRPGTLPLTSPCERAGRGSEAVGKVQLLPGALQMCQVQGEPAPQRDAKHGAAAAPCLLPSRADIIVTDLIDFR